MDDKFESESQSWQSDYDFSDDGEWGDLAEQGLLDEFGLPMETGFDYPMNDSWSSYVYQEPVGAAKGEHVLNNYNTPDSPNDATNGYADLFAGQMQSASALPLPETSHDWESDLEDYFASDLISDSQGSFQPVLQQELAAGTNPFSPNTNIASDAGFVDQFGILRPDTTREALELASEGKESSSVDITRVGADKAVITELNKGMSDLSGAEKKAYINEHAEEYKQVGAISIFAGGGYGEVLVDKLPEPATKVDYAVYGDYDTKRHYFENSPLTRDLALMPNFLENATIDTGDVKDYTKEYIAGIPEKEDFVGFVKPGSAVEISPGVFSTVRHVVAGENHNPGDRIQLDGKYFTIDKIVTADNDITVFTTKENPAATNLEPLQSIPVIPLSLTPVKKGDNLYYYGRPMGGKVKPREVVGDYEAKVQGAWPLRKHIWDGFSLDFLGIGGQSGSGIYQKDNFDKVLLKGNIVGPVNRYIGIDESPVDALFTPAQHTYNALDDLKRKY